MAGALETDPINELEESLECTVCLEPLKDPRTLPICLHSFCKDCLEDVVKTRRDEAPRGRPVREFPCPNCREMFTLDADKNVADMRRNHFICNIVKATAVLNRHRGTGVPCSHNCSQSYSVARCVTCEKFLCKQCLTGHNNYRGNTGHSVLTMEELSKPENRKKIKDKMYCDEHQGKKLKVYCETCDQLICKDCMDFKHVKPGHSCFLVKDVANKYKELLASNNMAMDGALTEGNAIVEQLTTTMEGLDRDAENSKSKIVQKKELMIKNVVAMLNKHTEALLNEVDQIHKSERAKLHEQTKETQQYVENIQKSVQLSKKLVEEGTEEEVISCQKTMLKSAKNLLKKRQEYFKPPVTVKNLNYTHTTSEEPSSEEISKMSARCLGIKESDLKVDKRNYRTQETASSIKSVAKMANESIEIKHACRTDDEPERPGSFRSHAVSPVHSAKKDSKRTLQCRYTFPNGKIIEVHQGDILSHPVDYLVNSANDELKHSGGLAGAIVEKGGRKIQEDSFRALNDLGKAKLLPGNVVTTDGGKLMCKEILHVVVPTYRPSESHAHDGDETREERYLRHCCTNVLEKATNGQTIAIPALGTGIYRIPHDISAKSLVEATCAFLPENPYHSLRQVHFVDNDPSAIEALMKEVLTRFKNDLNLHINEPVRDRWRPLQGASGGVPPPDTTSASADMAFQTPEGMEIRLIVGNIAKSTTDVIVNTVANDLNLTRNPCSKAILDEAGSAMKTFCEKWIKDNGQVKEEDFAITDGAKLKCKKVFHVVCPKWTPDQGEKKLREVVQKLLSKVQTLSLTSISIPDLGTGTPEFLEGLIAKILFEEATKFSSDHKLSLKIKTFNVVVYKGNTKAVNAFKEQFQVFSPTTDGNAPKTKRNTESDGSIFKATRKRLSSALGGNSGKEKSEDKTQGVEVEVVQGNIVEESTDAIGFLVSENITKGGQIGKALYKGAGEALRQEYKTLSKLYPGTVVMTTAGNLKVRRLLHMVIKAPTLGNDKTMIQNAVTKCLETADMYGFTSLSLPAVGTGHLQKDRKQSAEILYHCIKEYRKRDEKSLKLIRIVILQEKVFEEFNEALASLKDVLN